MARIVASSALNLLDLSTTNSVDFGVFDIGTGGSVSINGITYDGPFISGNSGADEITGINLFSAAELTEFSLTEADFINNASGLSTKETVAWLLSGNDTFELSSGSDRVSGFDGNDEIRAGGGDDRVLGGNGNDTLRGAKGEDTLVGGNGADNLFGQKHDDKLDGNDGDDRLNGGGGQDTLNGGSGNDFLKGGTKKDILNGGSGNDEIYGNRDEDRLNGGSGNDTLNGGGESDILNGGSGNDVLKGGSGADQFVFASNHGTDTVRDFDATDDNEVLDLSQLSGFSSFSDVQNSAQQTSAGVLISTGTDSSILLEGVNMSDLDAADFLF